MNTRQTAGVVLAVVAVLGVVAPVAAAPAGQDGQGATGASAGVSVGAADAPAASAAVADGCEYPFTSEDATGTEVTVEAEAQRVVTLAPSAAQTMWELNASEKVVGLSDNALYLAGADEKEIAVEGLNVQNEVVIGLEPDIVLAPDVVGNDTVAALRDAGLTVYKFEPTDNFSGIYEKTALIGQLTGECDEADALVADMRTRVDAIEQALADEDRPGALYSFFGYTAAEGTFIDNVITTAGLTNVPADLGLSQYPQLNDELIINNSDRIEWLVLNSDPTSHPSGGVYNGTTAVQQNQTVVVNVHYLNQPAPRTVRALETLVQRVHPEAYEEAQAIVAATPTPTATTTASPAPGTGGPTATPTDEPATTTVAMTDGGTTMADTDAATTSGNGPGFSVVVALLAVLAAALLGRRR
jgi:iron complex transport system substrate-binding protein